MSYLSFRRVSQTYKGEPLKKNNLTQTHSNSNLRSLVPMTLKPNPTDFIASAVRQTTLSDIRNHLAVQPNSAYQYLPAPSSLRIELLTPSEIPANLPSGNDVVPARIIIGYSKLPHVERNNNIYAYIFKTTDTDKASLRLGKRSLEASMLLDVEFEAPFDRICAYYANPDRAYDRMSLMVAYYFLASGYLDKVTTRLDFRVIFSDLCSKIFKHEVSSIRAQNGENESSDSIRSGNGVSLSHADELPLIDFSEPEEQPPTESHAGLSSEEETVADKMPYREAQSPITIETAQSAPSRSNKSPQPEINAPLSSAPRDLHPRTTKPLTLISQDIEDLSNFIQSFKALKAANTALAAENTTLTQRLTDTQESLNNVINKAHHLESDKVSLQNSLVNEQTESKVALKRIEQELHGSQLKYHHAQKGSQHATKLLVDLQNVQSEKKDLQDKNAKLQSQLEGLVRGNHGLVKKNLLLTAEMDKANAAPAGLRAEIESLERLVDGLGHENEEMKSKFADYKRMIREVSDM